ncbi:uro-adherence factor A [Chironomus tepperi]|uniref:uro-adherence factor A n=1 Tax=Chironomus tepperi TaxID=113505 RepID=UPI00391FA1D2
MQETKNQPHQQQSQSVPQRVVSVFVNKTINSVLKSSRKIIVRVCEVANVKKQFKMFQMYSHMQRRHNDIDEKKEPETTGHDRFYQERTRSSYRKKKRKNVRRTQSQTEFETRTATAANKRHLFRGRSVSSEQDNSESEHSEKSPLVSTKSLAKLLFNRSLSTQDNGLNRDSDSPTRSNIKYQYSAILDSGIGATDRSPRERAARDRAFTACTEWLISSGGRYEAIAHLDDIGSRSNKHWFLLNDSTIKTDRLMTLLPLPSNCVALEELPTSECPQGVLMELLGSLQHPYIYPILDLGFYDTKLHHYACLVTPFNPRGSLKDLIYKSQWNEPYNRKYTKKSGGLPISQVQRLGRQILEALLFLRDRGIPSHGHLHSGNVILQNGVARLSGLENNLLGLSSRVNSVLWSRSSTEIESIDVICFGHLLFEMCAGYELPESSPTRSHLQIDLERYPQVVEIMQMIFDSSGNYPSLEELVLCDLFRNIDLREMRGIFVPSFKHSMSNSTMSLLNAVRKRHSTMQGSFSEGSSPCTPPSTPHRHGRDEDLTMSESDHNLDEIVVTTLSTQISPIHYCDNGEPSISSSSNITSTSHKHQLSIDEKGTVIRISSFEEGITSSSVSSISSQQQQNVLQKQSSQTQCNQSSSSLDPSSAYKTTKTRRTEYSMRGIKIGCSNPSQDSAFGSMTDGELSRASSFKLSSFQSVSSPIDEGVEDDAKMHHHHLHDGNSLCTVCGSSSFKFIDSNSSACSSPCHPFDNFTQSLNDLNVPGPSSISHHHMNPLHGTNIKETCIYLDPPKLIVNDHSTGNYIYTSSPIRKCATTQEVFSQKYRVSSFEDMTASHHHLKNQVNKKQFRSFEEEQRIESAFTPIIATTSLSCDSEKYKVIKSANTSPIKSQHFTSTMTGKERSTLWKDSFLKCNKNNLTIKSNESIYEMIENQKNDDEYEEDDNNDTMNSSQLNEESSLSLSLDVSSPATTTQSSRRMRSDRLFFSLAKFKQNAIIELDTLSDIGKSSAKQLSQSCSSNDDESNIDNTTITSTTNDECNSDEECSSLTESLLKTSSHEEDFKRFVKSFDSEDNSNSTCNGEEKTPLLDGIELLSMTSSTDPE